MYLVYFDESGNSGTNYNDAHQPVFVLSALLVPHEIWPQLERDLEAIIEKFFPSPRWPGFEVHAGNIYAGRGEFRQITIDHRLAFCDAWFQAAQKHGLKLISRAIVKRKFHSWLQSEFGSGILINPHVVAFALVARVIDDYLRSLPRSPLGIFISDENKEIVHDIEKSIKVLRGIEGGLKLGQIIEKGFFIDSSKSLPLQLSDLCAYNVRKKEEQKEGLAVRSIHDRGMAAIEPLVYRGKEAWQDVLAWIKAQQTGPK